MAHSRISDLGAGQVQSLEIRKSAQMLQGSIGNLGLFQVSRSRLASAFRWAHASSVTRQPVYRLSAMVFSLGPGFGFKLGD